TDSSRDNHGLTWNTKKNHEAWKKYLGPLYGSEDIPPYASPAKQKDMTGLPPCYTFVCDGEPFLDETLDYVRALNEAGVPAKADVFHADQHAFDVIMPLTKAAKDARAAFLKNFGKAIGAIDE
ncbi:MAG: alpha/beta hydrolase fold domain-containing protein, partial [Clostridia bacterium]|nr:alpha/beta hydrolase fold domain-containing protein [Clostridia bacterium]